ncbi:helix-turn-helix domain-containing protein [Amycolatopsis vancoresmycina]|uniref:Transcriptional regulator n=1 Tax=Amycolatopsis vancoresmycina DSM 44592 TaxID=1292037 RepID=R1ICW2_9PSEU|nr:helix-turn-helix domain-containing protein [Amycolatopsis vancoresmycina]EOD70356.1 transcriptional regulator [Amycolatopsis vancoresmycina DSM 44592]
MAESFGAALLRLREAAGLSQRKLARAVPISQSALSRYEAGLQRPDERTAARLDDLLAAGGRLLELWPSLGTETLSPAEEERLADAADHPRRVDAAALDSLAGVLTAVRRLEDETSSAHVIPMVDAQRELARQFAAEARSAMRPVAVGLLSELEQYRGWLAIPGQRWEQARQHLDRAAVLGMEADDPLRLSTALSFSAYGAIRRHDLSTADALSEAARRDTRVHIGLRTYETYQRAEVLARNDERADAVRLLTEADGMVDKLPPADELPPSGYWYTPAFFLGQRAFVLRALGDESGARQAARDCLAEMPPEWTTSEWAARRRELADAS